LIICRGSSPVSRVIGSNKFTPYSKSYHLFTAAILALANR
jgi:hypothetical protein